MSGPTPPSREPHASGSHYQPSLPVVLVIVVVFVLATFLMVRAITPSSGSASTTVTTTQPASGSTSTTAPAIAKSKVRVQVANGTNVAGLAAKYTQILMVKGWDTLPAGNGTHVNSTIVYYTGQFRAEALEIASTIGVSSSSVQALGGLNPITGARTDDVIVLLGPNLAIG